MSRYCPATSAWGAAGCGQNASCVLTSSGTDSALNGNASGNSSLALRCACPPGWVHDDVFVVYENCYLPEGLALPMDIVVIVLSSLVCGYALFESLGANGEPKALLHRVALGQLGNVLFAVAHLAEGCVLGPAGCVMLVIMLTAVSHSVHRALYSILQPLIRAVRRPLEPVIYAMFVVRAVIFVTLAALVATAAYFKFAVGNLDHSNDILVGSLLVVVVDLFGTCSMLILASHRMLREVRFVGGLAVRPPRGRPGRAGSKSGDDSSKNSSMSTALNGPGRALGSGASAAGTTTTVTKLKDSDGALPTAGGRSSLPGDRKLSTATTLSGAAAAGANGSFTGKVGGNDKWLKHYIARLERIRISAVFVTIVATSVLAVSSVIHYVMGSMPYLWVCFLSRGPGSARGGAGACGVCAQPGGRGPTSQAQAEWCGQGCRKGAGAARIGAQWRPAVPLGEQYAAHGQPHGRGLDSGKGPFRGGH